ncbi:endonuclease domain-containing protein [Devosia sp. XJ19-1]|uniref:Endonuclease domain-containing protein n=1 Tax=Devosia ureilytica TaxID=2952754 RepID=A0A9Q4FRX7_9HYPH|nr:endonuclease domain-containing protein [Devosia ureilytica]MCP8883348.1 endonuclease domain-containing protein [Devosia ureilytica]MCP8886284.1 endonuclease domain-containing protein [Devosia ureilytica]
MDDPVTFARKLRREQTLPERRFWGLVRPWREAGLHWRRQAPIGPYVVDFVCKARNLIVEIDGDTHYSEAGLAHDESRTAYLAERGHRVLRFTNSEVTQGGEGVYTVLMGVLGEPGAER